MMISPDTLKAPANALPQLVQQRFVRHPSVLQLLQTLPPSPQKTAKTPAEAPALHVGGVHNPTLKALLLQALLKQAKGPVVVVTPDPQELLRLHAALEPLWETPAAFEAEVLRYPSDLFSPYELSLLPTAVLQGHYHVLEAFAQQKPCLVLLHARSLLATFAPFAQRQAEGLHFVANQEYAIDGVLTHLLALGYYSVGCVTEAGTFSHRGDILDIFPVYGPPVRLSFFGETLENIRLINPQSQRSVGTVPQAHVLPRTQWVRTATSQQRLAQRLPQRLQAQSKALGGEQLEGLAATLNTQLQALEQGLVVDGLDYYASLAHEAEAESLTHLAACIPPQAVVVLDDWGVLSNHLEGYGDRLSRQCSELQQRGQLLDLGYPLHKTPQEALGALTQAPRRKVFAYPTAAHAALPTTALTKGLPTDAVFELNPQPLPRFQANLVEACQHFAASRKQGHQVVVVTDYPQRVLDVCQEQDVPALYAAADTQDAHSLSTLSLPLKGLEVLVTRSGLTDGLALEPCGLLYLTDAELFGRHRVRRGGHDPQHKRTQTAKEEDGQERIQSISELRPGDHVVHLKHGIGQFVQLQALHLEGQTREYLELLYKSNDKLFVPVDQLHLLRRYNGAGNDATPTLSKMGGAEWKKVTSKVKQSVAYMAKELVALYKARQTVQGFPFEVDTPWQVELEESFPYEETPDQWKAIGEAKTDMEAPVPMDRLVCGDVGFGKTEVAIRAVFKAVLGGKQSAVLVPTTILAQQHFNTFAQRYQPYGVRVGLLSRFRSPKEQKDLLQRLKAGELDVVIGTHRLLQKDVVFKDLGLLVIDEEHRFGVAHKERMKQMRTHVDVLSMSATPIPRTLYMSLSGVRPMSLINTPPVNRLPVQTIVGPFNPAQLRMAVLHELDRGGQVYYIHNRVQSLYSVAERLKELVPEVKVAVAHGQMGPSELETVMLDFASGQYDVLLATTIVESGVDIPSANTLIIDDADRYGLAQLYQLRGRVGRSDVQAYAYLYYDAEKDLSDEAKRRLQAIRELTALGSGYHIAMRDMEIRGVGNILGAEQHGHMVQVGFEFYCELLNEAVEAAQAGEVVADEGPEPSVIDLNVTALIPEAYVGGQDVKLSEYRRLAAVHSERALELILAEWQDRFGPVPWQAAQLVELARLRVQATHLGIPLVRSDDSELRIQVPYSLKQWMSLQGDLPQGLGNKFRWVAPAKANDPKSLPLLQHRHNGNRPEALLKLVQQLFSALVAVPNPNHSTGATEGAVLQTEAATAVNTFTKVALPAAATVASAAQQQKNKVLEARLAARERFQGKL
jgi:transcription-repair coupling factor (superfamily II helicase)